MKTMPTLSRVRIGRHALQQLLLLVLPMALVVLALLLLCVPTMSRQRRRKLCLGSNGAHV